MKIKYNGKNYQTLKDLCVEYGISYSSITSYKKDLQCTMEEAIDYYVKNSRRENRPWTAEEEATVRQMADEGYSRKEIAAKIGRTPNALCKFCNVKGIHTHAVQKKIFEEEKKEILAANNHGLDRIAEKFDCSIYTVLARNKKMGGYQKPIRHEEDIRKRAGIYSAEEIAEQLGLKVENVRRIAWKCNISLATHRKRKEWTNAELIYLRDHRHDTSLKDICANLGRRKATVLQKCKALGI